MGHVRITPLDGKIPNLALMRLAAWHASRGDEVHLVHQVKRSAFEPAYDRVYASAIFKTTQKKLAIFLQHFPDAVVGGTGSGSTATVEDVVGDFDGVDYMDYTETVAKRMKGRSNPLIRPWQPSIGFTQRGCRLKCGFCVVPNKEGKNRSVSTLAEIWRGPPFPRDIYLLDNDFFGQELWRERIAEAREGRFRLALSQGINVRKVDEEVAEAVASVDYRSGNFKERKLYTAWDNLGDEKVFFKGVDTLERAGVPPTHLMAYMLTGFDRKETWDRIHHRFDRMAERGIEPFVMVFDPTRTDLKRFQRWANTGLYRVFPFSEYVAGYKTRNQAPDQLSLFDLGGPGFVQGAWSDDDDDVLAGTVTESGSDGDVLRALAERLSRTPAEVVERLAHLGLVGERA